MWTELLARFRALSLFYQQAHWACKGSWFYQDHLLFERLYNEVNDAIDMIAEKGIGESMSVEHVLLANHLPMVMSLCSGCPGAVADNVAYVNYGLGCEQALCEFLAGAFRAEDNFGVQNMLQGLIDDGLQRVYLLRERSTLGPATDGSRPGGTLQAGGIIQS